MILLVSEEDWLVVFFDWWHIEFRGLYNDNVISVEELQL